MKKNVFLCCACSVLMMTSLASCGKTPDASAENQVQYGMGLSENGFYTDVNANEIVTLPEDFAEIKMPESELSSIENGVDDFLAYVKSQGKTGAVVTDRTSEVGDTVNIDYEGRIDGVLFDGGSDSSVDVEIGSDSFIEGFEDALVGHNAGDEFEITVTFPDGYGTTTNANNQEIELSGKTAVFSVKINSIRVVELNDELVQDVFSDETTLSDGSKIDSVDKAKEYYKENEKNSIVTSFIQSYLMEKSSINEESDSYKTIVNQQLEIEKQYVQFMADLYSYESVDSFLKDNGYENGLSEYLSESMSSIESSVKANLIVQAVAEKLEIQVDDADYDKYLGDTKDSTFETYGQAFSAQMVLSDKVVDYLVNNVVIE